jgi:tetratricopeptide (TPR) repeat protein
VIADGDADMAKQQYVQAEESYRHALEFAENHWKKDARISSTLIKLAESCDAQGKKDDAEALANRALIALQDAVKAHKPKNASEEYEHTAASAAIDDKAGDIFAANQKYPEAEKLYSKEVALWERYAAQKPPSKPGNEDFFRFMLQNIGGAQEKTADADNKLAALYVREGKFEQAEQEYRKSQAIREKEDGRNQPPVAKSLINRAACFGLQAKYDQAEPLYKRAIEILENSSYRDKSEMAVALENYSLLLKKTGRDAEAKAVSERAQQIRTNMSGIFHLN